MTKSDRDIGMAAFATLVSALGGGEKGGIMPADDASDFRDGATYIPSEVTLARRRGQTVRFVNSGSRGKRYWLMPDGTKITHE